MATTRRAGQSEFWESVEKTAREVAKWPLWMQRPTPDEILGDLGREAPAPASEAEEDAPSPGKSRDAS